MKSRQWQISEDQFKTYQKANGQFCSLNTCLFYHLQTHQCVYQLIYAKDKDSIKKSCSLQIRKANSVSIPTSICSKCLDINFSTCCSVTRNNHSSALKKHLDSSKHRHPSTVLWLPPACSATSQHFHLPPHYETAGTLFSTYHLTQPISML